MIEYTEKTDIWSIGVILYNLLTKKKPFYGKSYEELLYNLVHKKIDFSLENFLNYSTSLI